MMFIKPVLSIVKMNVEKLLLLNIVSLVEVRLVLREEPGLRH